MLFATFHRIQQHKQMHEENSEWNGDGAEKISISDTFMDVRAIMSKRYDDRGRERDSWRRKEGKIETEMR